MTEGKEGWRSRLRKIEEGRDQVEVEEGEQCGGKDMEERLIYGRSGKRETNGHKGKRLRIRKKRKGRDQVWNGGRRTM